MQIIKNILKEANQAWSSGKPEELTKFFHDDVIIVAPDLKVMGSGKEQCIRSYIDFLNNARVIEFSDGVPEVHIYENTAVAFYTFHISWEDNGKQFTEKGKELYIFNKVNGNWLIVMRQILPAGNE